MEIKPNTIIQNDNKTITFYNSSILVNNDNRTESIFSLCDLNIPYDTISMEKLTLTPNSTEIKIVPESMSGSGVTSLIIKVKYDVTGSTCSNDKGYLNYRLEGYPLSDRKIGEIMVLTGTNEKRIPQVYLYNSSGFNANIEVMIGTTQPVGHQINTDIVFSDLYYNDIITDVVENGNFSGSTMFNILNKTGVTVSNIEFSKIDIITIDDTKISILTDSYSKISLNFVDRYNTEQCLSRMNWVREQSYDRYITRTYPSLDNTAPLIEFKFTGDTLTIQEPMNQYPVVLTKDDIRFYFINKVEDYDDSNQYRDGIINNSNVDVKIINKINGNIIENIELYGEYQIKFSISDLAGNKVNHVKNLIYVI